MSILSTLPMFLVAPEDHVAEKQLVQASFGPIRSGSVLVGVFNRNPRTPAVFVRVPYIISAFGGVKHRCSTKILSVGCCSKEKYWAPKKVSIARLSFSGFLRPGDDVGSAAESAAHELPGRSLGLGEAKRCTIEQSESPFTFLSICH